TSLSSIALAMGSGVLYISMTLESLIGVPVPVLSPLGDRIGASIPVFLITLVLYYILSLASSK
ncbi:hypothetical protein, partial [Serratia marcescens]|uniref:hypothetical protein n=1 Tax=Serratia marcescens TaxID=615 RepID=UPI001954C515